MELLELKKTRSSELLKEMLEVGIIKKVEERGKYKF